MKYILTFILLFSIVFTQEPCIGTCLSEEETINLFHNIHELEFKDSTNQVIIKNLNSQIVDYELLMNNYKSTINSYETKVQLQDELIKEVTPKWYENRWLWFGIGIFGTTTVFNVVD